MLNTKLWTKVKNGSDELDDKINDLSTQFCIIKHDHQHQQQHESSEWVREKNYK